MNLSECKDEYTKIKKAVASNPSTNYERRNLYARSELLQIRLDEILKKESDESISSMKSELESISEQMHLHHVKRSTTAIGKVLEKVDEVFRLIGAWSFLALSATSLALPCVFFYPVDQLLLRKGIIKADQQLNVRCRRFIAFAMMKLSGVDVVVEGPKEGSFGKDCSIVCFSHASTLDAFLISGATPVRALTMAKAELFLIPFFSWCLMAFGGVPIDRSNRNQAVGAIQDAANAADEGQCVSIAPEGTRSKSGNITAFKKGAFYLWEQLQTPIVPLVIFGAFDLFPPAKHVAIPGKVYMKFLDPILPHEASNREEMLILVRRRMLEAWRDGPADVACDLTLRQKLEYICALFAFYGTLIGLGLKFPLRKILASYGLTLWQAAGLSLGGSIVITLVFYVYLMFISRWFAKPSKSGKIGSGKEKGKDGR